MLFRSRAAVERLVFDQLGKRIGDASFSLEDRARWQTVRHAVSSADATLPSASPTGETTEPTFELHYALCRQFVGWRRLRTYLEQLFKIMLPGALELWRLPLNHWGKLDLDNLPNPFLDEWRATIFRNSEVTQLIAKLIPGLTADSQLARQDFWTIARAIRNDADLRSALLTLSHNDRPKLFLALKQLLAYHSKRTADEHLRERDVLVMNATATIDRKTKTPHELRDASRKRLVQEVFTVLKREIPDLDSNEFLAAETRLHRCLVAEKLRTAKPAKKPVK